MADPNTQNPPKQSFEIKPEDLQAPTSVNSPVKEPSNPLNTGNGGPTLEPQSVQPEPVKSGVSDPAVPHEIKLGEQTPENLEKKLEEQLSETSKGEGQDKAGNTKKYLIIGISILGLAVIAFVVYKFFLPETDTVIEENNLPAPTNSLIPADETPPVSDEALPESDETPPASDETPPSEGMKELKEVVDELEGTTTPETEEVFDEAVLEDVTEKEAKNSAATEEDFPSLTLPDETSEDSTPPADTEGKLLR